MLFLCVLVYVECVLAFMCIAPRSFGCDGLASCRCVFPADIGLTLMLFCLSYSIFRLFYGSVISRQGFDVAFVVVLAYVCIEPRSFGGSGLVDCSSVFPADICLTQQLFCLTYNIYW
jgi:hypothetical protein